MNDYYLLRRAWARLHTPIDGWLFWLVFWAACFALGCLIAYGGISAH